MKSAEDCEIACEAEINDMLLTHPEFCADVRMFVNRGTSFKTILIWLTGAVKKSTSSNNGFTPTGVDNASNYYNFLAAYADQYGSIPDVNFDLD